jgi:hypothetical protein
VLASLTGFLCIWYLGGCLFVVFSVFKRLSLDLTMSQMFGVLNFFLCCLMLLERTFLSDCPWNETTDGKDKAIQSLKQLVESIVDCYSCFVLLLIAVGYHVILGNISHFSFKIVFVLTASKFILDQAYRVIYNVTFLVPTVITIRILFDVLILVVVLAFSFGNIKGLNQVQTALR